MGKYGQARIQWSEAATSPVSHALTSHPLTSLKEIVCRPVTNCPADIPHEFVQFAGVLVVGGAGIDQDAPAETVVGTYHKADGSGQSAIVPVVVAGVHAPAFGITVVRL